MRPALRETPESRYHRYRSGSVEDQCEGLSTEFPTAIFAALASLGSCYPHEMSQLMKYYYSSRLGRSPTHDSYDLYKSFYERRFTSLHIPLMWRTVDLLVEVEHSITYAVSEIGAAKFASIVGGLLSHEEGLKALLRRCIEVMDPEMERPLVGRADYGRTTQNLRTAMDSFLFRWSGTSPFAAVDRIRLIEHGVCWVVRHKSTTVGELACFFQRDHTLSPERSYIAVGYTLVECDCELVCDPEVKMFFERIREGLRRSSRSRAVNCRVWFEKDIPLRWFYPILPRIAITRLGEPIQYGYKGVHLRKTNSWVLSRNCDPRCGHYLSSHQALRDVVFDGGQWLGTLPVVTALDAEQVAGLGRLAWDWAGKLATLYRCVRDTLEYNQGYINEDIAVATKAVRLSHFQVEPALSRSVLVETLSERTITMLAAMTADANRWHKALLRRGFLGFAGEKLCIHMPGGSLQFRYRIRGLTRPTCEAYARTSGGPSFRRAYPAEILGLMCEWSTSQPGIIARGLHVLGTLLGTTLLSIPSPRCRELGLVERDGWPDGLDRVSRVTATGENILYGCLRPTEGSQGACHAI